MATKPAFPEGITQAKGSTFLGWGYFDTTFMPEEETDKCGSYGINAWVYNPPRTQDEWEQHRTENNWRTPTVKGTGNIPLFLDCTWLGGSPESYDDPPEYDGQWELERGASSMKRFCINRHNEHINGFFELVGPADRA